MPVLSSRRGLFMAGTLVFALFLALFSINWMLRYRQNAEQARLELAQCRHLERTILTMRQQTSLVSARELDSQELGQRIDASARQAQLNLASLEGVYPQPAQRAGNLPYVQKSTALVLRKVELRSLASFLFELTSSPGMTVRQLRLRAPLGDVPSALWDADATITCLIYSPNDASPARGD